MKKLIAAFLFVTLGAFSLVANTSAYTTDLANEAVSYNKAYTLDVLGNNITYATAQADYSDATPAAKTFTDGNVSTGSIVVETLASLTTAYATNTVTILSTTGLTGATIAIGPVSGLPAYVFKEGRDWRKGATTTTAATNLAAAMTAKIPGLTFTPSSNTVVITAPRVGTYYNSIPVSVDHSSLTLTAATLTGGQDNAFVTINGVILYHNKDWYVGASSATAAISLMTAINANTTLAALLTASTSTTIGDTGKVFLQSDATGAQKNFSLVSSIPAALTASGAAMTGGTASQYTTGSSVIAVPAHGFNMALPVLYTEGAAPADPLVDQTTYYVSVVDADSIKLATTSARAVLGLGVTITATPAPVNIYTLMPLPISGSSPASFKWQVSNDNLAWTDMSAASVTVSNFATLPLTTVWDFGNIGFHYLRLNVIAPTAGALGLTANVNGTPLSEFVPSVGGTMSGQLSMSGVPIVLTGVNGYVHASSTITAPQFTGALVGSVTGGLSGGAVSATTLTASGAGNITGQFIWGAGATRSTGTVTGALTIPGTLTAAASSVGGTSTAAMFNVTGSGQILTGNASSTALGTLVPGQAKGALITNSTTGELCTSTATVVGSWVLVRALGTACY